MQGINLFECKETSVLISRYGTPRNARIRYKFPFNSTPTSFFTKRVVFLSLCFNLHTIQYSYSIPVFLRTGRQEDRINELTEI